MSDRVARICAELIRRRVISREEMPEWEVDLDLRADVNQKLGEVGMQLLDRPGVPFYGVAMLEVYRSDDNVSDHSLTSRHLGLILFLWLRFVAPYVYGETSLPKNYKEIKVAKDTLVKELPGDWTASTLDRYLGRLRTLNFIEVVRGEGEICAGPMLWLAIDHERLSHFLREEKGLPIAIQRFLSEEKTIQGN